MSSAIRMTIAHVHLDSNCLFRTSYDFYKPSLEDFTTADVLNTQAVVSNFYMNMLATTMRMVEIRTTAMVFDALGFPGEWSEGEPLGLTEFSVTGTRPLVGEPLTVGFGNYVVQKDLRLGGRSGRMILKFGFSEEMVQASLSRWFFQTSTDTGEWTTRWTSQLADPDGNIGQLFASGNLPNIKLCNFHKSFDTPVSQTGWISKWLSAYKTPRPTVEG